jgi:uncharacterized protein YjiS (DUF1127 family)
MRSTSIQTFEDLHRNNDIPAVSLTDSTSPLAALFDGVRTAVARYRYRRTVRGLAHFQPHLLRDMGFEPHAVYEAAEGDWRWIDARGRRG